MLRVQQFSLFILFFLTNKFPPPPQKKRFFLKNKNTAARAKKICLVQFFIGIKTSFLYKKKNLDKSGKYWKKCLLLKKLSLSQVHFYLVPDSYSRAQTRESVESAKKGLEYETFEYESRLDTALAVTFSLPISTLLWFAHIFLKKSQFKFKFIYKLAGYGLLRTRWLAKPLACLGPHGPLKSIQVYKKYI